MNALSPVSNMPSTGSHVSLSADKKTILLSFGGRTCYEIKAAKGDLPAHVMEALKSLFEEKITDIKFKQNIENAQKNKETCRVDLNAKKCIFYENDNQNKHTIKNEYKWSHSAEKTRAAVTSALNLPKRPISVSISELPAQPKMEMRSPSGISNPNIACYRIASIQGLCSSLSFRRLLEQNIEMGEDRKERNTIRLALLNLLKMLDEKKSTPAQLSHAEIHLNKLIESYSIKKQHFLTFVDPNYPQDRQLDANDFVDFLLTEVLMQSNTYEKRISGTAHNNKGERVEINNRLIKGTPSSSSVLSLNPTGMINPTLSDMINKNFKESVINQPFNIDHVTLSQYEQQIKILDQPKPMLAVRVERGSFNTKKNEVEINKTPLKIPENNLVDLSTAYGNKEGTNLYGISSFIMRTSGGKYANRAGHFISYVKKGNQWFECNDAIISSKSPEDIKKIIPNAYMFFLEKN